MSYRESPPDGCRTCGAALVMIPEITSGRCVECHDADDTGSVEPGDCERDGPGPIDPDAYDDRKPDLDPIEA